MPFQTEAATTKIGEGVIPYGEEVSPDAGKEGGHPSVEGKAEEDAQADAEDVVQSRPLHLSHSLALRRLALHTCRSQQSMHDHHIDDILAA